MVSSFTAIKMAGHGEQCIVRPWSATYVWMQVAVQRSRASANQRHTSTGGWRDLQEWPSHQDSQRWTGQKCVV